MIRFSAKGALRAARNMKDAKEQLQDMRPTLKKAAILVLSWTQRNIKQEGALHKNRKYAWPPLAESTIRARRTGKKKGKKTRRSTKAIPITAGRVPMLQDTGRLIGGFLTFTATKTSKVINKVVDPQSRVAYAPDHELGKGNVPQRKMFPDTAQGVEIVNPAFKALVRKATK